MLARVCLPRRSVIHGRRTRRGSAVRQQQSFIHVVELCLILNRLRLSEFVFDGHLFPQLAPPLVLQGELALLISSMRFTSPKPALRTFRCSWRRCLVFQNFTSSRAWIDDPRTGNVVHDQAVQSGNLCRLVCFDMPWDSIRVAPLLSGAQGAVLPAVTL